MLIPAVVTIAVIAALAAIALAIIGWRPRQEDVAAPIGARIGAVTLLAVAAVLIGFVVFVSLFVNGLVGATDAQEVPCQQVATFVDQTSLPAGLTNARCTREGFQDTLYTMDATVSRSAFASWLSGLPTAPSLDDQGCGAGVDLCTDQIEFVPRATGGADYAAATATVQPDGSLRVEFSAFNV